jgi:hypothetical protein
MSSYAAARDLVEALAGKVDERFAQHNASLVAKINDTRKGSLILTSSIADLLIAKGIFTQDELKNAIIRNTAQVDQVWTQKMDEINKREA